MTILVPTPKKQVYTYYSDDCVRTTIDLARRHGLQFHSQVADTHDSKEVPYYMVESPDGTVLEIRLVDSESKNLRCVQCTRTSSPGTLCWGHADGVATLIREGIDTLIKADKAERPLPDWAKQALAAGWKMPKGWTP